MKLSSYIRAGLGLSLFGVAMAYGALLSLLGVNQAKVKERVARIMAGPVLRVLRIRVKITGRERLQGLKAALVVGNQQSVICYCIYATLFQEMPESGIVARLTGKWNIPVVTHLFRRTGNYMVDPRNPLRTAVGFVDARRDLMEGRGKVWMGPEGTRWREPGVLGPFKPGAFRLAVEAQVPIVPLVISPLKPETDLSVPRLDPREVELRILDPIATAGKTGKDVSDLKEGTRTLMQEALSRMAGERRSTPG